VTGDDPYAVLGVRADAKAEDIHRAYVRLARLHHPDYFVDAPAAERAAAEARMRAVNDAWSVLGDAGRRRSFDAARPRPFQPFEPVDEDEPDPREQPDIPYRSTPPPSGRARAATIAPVALFAASVGIAALSVVTGAALVLGLAAIVFLLSCVGFLVVPLLALGRARRDEG